MLDEYKKNIRKPNPEELRLIKLFGTKGIFEYVRGLGKIFDCFLFE